jgi:hypothetical protein
MELWDVSGAADFDQLRVHLDGDIVLFYLCDLAALPLVSKPGGYDKHIPPVKDRLLSGGAVWIRSLLDWVDPEFSGF